MTSSRGTNRGPVGIGSNAPSTDEVTFRIRTRRPTSVIGSAEHDSGLLVAQARRKGPRKKGGKRGKVIVIYAAGYANPYPNQQAEIAAIDARLSGLAISDDFEATALQAKRKNKWQNTFPATTSSEFFGPLVNVKGLFRRIIFLGHGLSSGGIGFSGQGTQATESLELENFELRQPQIDERIKPKLLSSTRIDLYACNVATKKKFMRAMANAFECTVRSFPEPLGWCVAHDGNKITSRGRMATLSAFRTAATGGKIGPGGVTCSEDVFKTLEELVPPNETEPSKVSSEE